MLFASLMIGMAGAIDQYCQQNIDIVYVHGSGGNALGMEPLEQEVNTAFALYNQSHGCNVTVTPFLLDLNPALGGWLGNGESEWVNAVTRGIDLNLPRGEGYWVGYSSGATTLIEIAARGVRSTKGVIAISPKINPVFDYSYLPLWAKFWCLVFNGPNFCEYTEKSNKADAQSLTEQGKLLIIASYINATGLYRNPLFYKGLHDGRLAYAAQIIPGGYVINSSHHHSEFKGDAVKQAAQHIVDYIMEVEQRK